MRRRRCAVRSTAPILLAAAPLLLTGCGVDVARARQSESAGYAPPSLAVAALRPTAAAGRETSSGELLTFDGDEFTLRYPGDATVRPLEGDAAPGASAALEIRGPELRDVEGDPIEGSATYSFEVVSYPNPDRLSLDAWLARHRERENDADALRTAAAAGETVEAPTSASVGGLAALRESRFGGDCRLVRYYVARGTRVIALRYADFPVESDSLNPENLRTYRKVMNSFRWKGS
jgi:hypothetical protein